MQTTPTNPSQLPDDQFRKFLWDTWIPVIFGRLIVEFFLWIGHLVARAEDRFEWDFGLNEDFIDSVLFRYVGLAAANSWKTVTLALYQLFGALIVLAVIGGISLGTTWTINYFAVERPAPETIQKGIPTPPDKTPVFSPTPSFLSENQNLSSQAALNIRNEKNMVRLVTITSNASVGYSDTYGVSYRGENQGSQFIWAEEQQPPPWLASVGIHGYTIELQISTSLSNRLYINAYEPFRYVGNGTNYDPNIYVVVPNPKDGTALLLIAHNPKSILVPYTQASPPVNLPANLALTPQD